ncbi:DEAD/DEAH box helicase [Leptospira vanthielii]|uniref:DEAD/DEAH box helicase n=1 Tax=Leptospira vanthielii serovar Holland str. Waz Holland = ATCC 700522 TaxID=1218591 RepID=N1W9Q1_9LEPT|nr:DEAD/DEAH box helicase [Leptospira vanthielii]EMY70165.1 DEAD/DEAH box helicase [Leptospira vanthielii serovar Holland str. Waz Holland = ATCC 700522]
MSFELLSEPIRRYVYDQRWEQLRPIQNAAIEKLLSSNENYILASRTASGKTEAAFLPILSRVDFAEPGVQVLYVSPLIALINDQFYRIEQLCKYLDVTVTKWHGEANKTQKDRLLDRPTGIVLITPESLEAMFTNKPHNIKHLFSNIKYVVVDEIHSFLGTDRGIQLKSILSRLQTENLHSFRIIGLSATIGDYLEAKRFTGDESNTKVLLDRTPKDINVLFRYFKNKTEELPLELLKDLYIETKDKKVLIFPNSRGRVEEIAVKLKKISNTVKGHGNYFSHHSSVDKEVREYVEFFAKESDHQNFCISCTSTLELGIDIGTIDEVVQVDATQSIASLIQRVGRSGRKDGQSSNLFLYATNDWSLLQSLACWALYKENFIEPPQINEKPYDILLHQALSIAKGKSGINISELTNQLKGNFAFKQIEQMEIEEILHHLIKINFLEKLRHEVIIGIEGEKIVNSRDFYSVFKVEENFKVLSVGNSIGEIPFSPQVQEDENILLAAKIWKIIFIDHSAKKIEVRPANDGKKPMFFGSEVLTHNRIREKMFEILYSDVEYTFLDQQSLDEIKNLRNFFASFKIQNLKAEKPLLIANNSLTLYTFTGTKINRTIQFLLDIAGFKNQLEYNNCSFEIKASKEVIQSKWNSLVTPILNIDKHIFSLLQSNPSILDFSKWGSFLPDHFKVMLIKNRYFDFKETEEFLTRTTLIENHR